MNVNYSYVMVGREGTRRESNEIKEWRRRGKLGRDEEEDE